jgi:phytoene synthase
LRAADSEVEDAVRRGDPDRWLASRFISDPSARADVVALLAFDLELARAPRVTTNPLTAEIRLVWWAEVLAEIFGGQTVRPHPTAQALAAAVRRRGLERAPLESLIETRRAYLFESVTGPESALAWADGVTGAAAVSASRILDPQARTAPARLAGRALGLGLLTRARVLAADDLRGLLLDALAQANRALGGLSAKAFPAVAAATLARDDLKGGAAPEISRRLRLVWAVARGRI